MARGKFLERVVCFLLIFVSSILSHTLSVSLFSWPRSRARVRALALALDLDLVHRGLWKGRSDLVPFVRKGHCDQVPLWKGHSD